MDRVAEGLPQLPLFVAAAAALAGLGVTAWGMIRALR
jgi:hypothetical protein